MTDYVQAIFVDSCGWQIEQPQVFIVYLNAPGLRAMWGQLKGVKKKKKTLTGNTYPKSSQSNF